MRENVARKPLRAWHCQLCLLEVSSALDSRSSGGRQSLRMFVNTAIEARAHYTTTARAMEAIRFVEHGTLRKGKDCFQRSSCDVLVNPVLQGLVILAAAQEGGKERNGSGTRPSAVCSRDINQSFHCELSISCQAAFVAPPQSIWEAISHGRLLL